MREFVILGHEAPLTPEFSLDDLPGAAGRLDVLCRCVTDALLRSHGIRADVGVSLVLQDELTIRFDGREIRRLQPDERSTAARIRSALDAAADAVGLHPVDVAPGLTVSRRDLETTLAELDDRGGTMLLLHEDGEPIAEGSLPDDPVFVLSDHRSFAEGELATIQSMADQSWRLGPVALHADQAITVAHNFLDTEGYRQY